jgi:beta-mannosidase
MRRVLAFERQGREPGPDADAVDHEYAASVTLDEDDLSGACLLEVNGIASAYDVLVNGTPVLAGSSMFERHVVDVREALVSGANTVQVRVRPLSDVLDEMPRKPRARWRTMLVEEPRLRWVRTSILGRAPGFAPGPPVVGPFRPVQLVLTDVYVHSLALRPSVVEGVGILEVEVVVHGSDVLSFELTGPDGTSTIVDVPIDDDGAGRTRIEVADVALWWPHTHGEPVQYELRAFICEDEVDLPGDGTTTSGTRRIGFRTVQNASADSMELLVNGVPVFVRGAVWTPGDLDALDTAVGLGLNLVRVPGTAAYESDAFHARCDELGLLVWQDLMFATFDYPLAEPEFAAEVVREVRHQAARLLGHPSTVVVCGSAEHEQQAAMFGINPETGYAKELAVLTRPLVEESGLDAIWVDSSPCGGDLPIRVDTGIAQYFGVGAYLRGLPDARHSGVRFAAECLAFSNLPDPVVPDPVEPGGVPRDTGADWDFADVREHYLLERYGQDASETEAQRVTGEVMADVFGEWRRPQSPCGGGIVLWLRDLVPGAGWGLLDHTGRPKPAALALAPVLQPTAVWLVDEGLNGIEVHVAHDRGTSENQSLVVALLREDGSVLESAAREWVMEPHGHRVFSVDALLGRFADSAYAYRFGPPQHAAVRASLSTESSGTREAIWRLHL